MQNSYATSMRCKNCGWENPDNSVRCEKCNAPLTGSMGEHNSDNDYHSKQNTDRPLSGTVKESSVFSSPSFNDQGTKHRQSIDSSNSEDAAAPVSCPKCGYPLRPDMKVCPSCGTPLNSFKKNTPDTDSAKKCSKCGAPVKANEKFCSNCGASLRMGTVNNWANPSQSVFCTLKPIAWANEGIEHQPISYSGDTIILNRSNTDPNNNSITSKEQAALIHNGNDWFIENRSEQETTYIKVSKKTKLESGDVIILGNRLFEFKG